MDSPPRRPVGWRNLPTEIQQMIVRYVLPTHVSCTLLGLQLCFGRTDLAERGYFTLELETYQSLASIDEIRDIALRELDQIRPVARLYLEDVPCHNYRDPTRLWKWFGPDARVSDPTRSGTLPATYQKYIIRHTWDGPVLPRPLRCLHVEYVNHWCVKVEPPMPPVSKYQPSNITYLHLTATIKILPTLDIDSVDWQVHHICGPNLSILDTATVFATPAKDWFSCAETRLTAMAPRLKEKALARFGKSPILQERLKEGGCPYLNEGYLLAVHAACDVLPKQRVLEDEVTGNVWTLSSFRGGKWARGFMEARKEANGWGNAGEGPTRTQEDSWCSLMKNGRCRGAGVAARELEVKLNWGKGGTGEHAATPAGRVCQLPWILM